MAENLVSKTVQALETFYHGSNPTEREAAHKCLLEVQQSKEAWQICWKLLGLPEKVESQYFGASMLHYKISKFWKELSEDDYIPLKDEIIKYICLFASGTKMVFSKLCAVLAAYILHVVPEPLPNGCEESINDLQKKLSMSSRDVHPVVLEYLTVMPEEFSTSTINGFQRTAVRQQLNDLIPKVLEMLKGILESRNLVTFHSAAVKCLHPWVQFGASITDCQSLIPSLLNMLNDENHIEESSSVLVELLSHPTSFKRENSVYAFLENMDGFENLLMKAMAESDLDNAKSICKILTSVGETHANLLRQAATDDQQKHCLQLVNLILKCTGIVGNYPVDETCSELTFTFWYTFQDELLTINPDTITNYHFCLREAFVALIQILFQKVQFPDENIYESFTSDEKEMLRCYRQDIQDTVTYICSLLRERCLQSLTELLKYLLSGEKSVRWQEVEAVLYLFQGTSEYTDNDDPMYLQTVISLLPLLPTHPKVLESAVYMIGSFSEWLSSHPDQLGFILPILQNGISENQLSTACTLSLRDICRESSLSFPQNVSLDIVNTCLSFLKSKRLKEKEQIRCIECIGYVLAGLPVKLKEEQQNLMTSFLLEMLQSAIKFSLIDPSATKLVHHWIQCYSAYFRSCDSDNESSSGYHSLIPVFTGFIQAIQSMPAETMSEMLVQDVMNAVNKAVDTIRDPFYAVLPQTSLVIFGMFSAVPTAIVLEVSSTIIGMLGNVKESSDMLQSFFQRLVQESVLLLESKVAGKDPDLIQGFLVLLNRAVKSAPCLLFKDRQMHVKVIQHALQALSFQESPTIKASCNFFVSYITAAASEKCATEMLDLFGQDLVSRVLLSIAGQSPRTSVDLFADILLVLNRHFITKTSLWLQACLSQDGFPSPIVELSQKNNFRKAVLREMVNKRALKEIVRKFSLICRGLHGMPYVS